jgi:hypothetical protein
MRYVIDVEVALHLVRRSMPGAPEHELLPPTPFRSQLLSRQPEAVHRRELEMDEAMEELASVRALRLRLLGDAVLQRQHRDLAPGNSPGDRPQWCSAA